MAISSRQVQNKRDGNGVLTGRPGTVYDVNIKYKAPDGTKKSYAKKGFSTKKEAAQHEAEMKTKLQNPGQIAAVTNHGNEAEQSFIIAGKEITAKLLAEALRSLPEEKRETILLYYFFDMSETEISRLCNIPRTTVKYRRNSSFELLKRYLEERAYDCTDW